MKDLEEVQMIHGKIQNETWRRHTGDMVETPVETENDKLWKEHVQVWETSELTVAANEALRRITRGERGMAKTEAEKVAREDEQDKRRGKG